MSQGRLFKFFVTAAMGLVAAYQYTDELASMIVGKHEGVVAKDPRLKNMLIKGESFANATSLFRAGGSEDDPTSARNAWDTSNYADTPEAAELANSVRYQEKLASAKKSYRTFLSATSALDKYKALVGMNSSLGGSEALRKQFQADTGFSRKDYFKAIAEQAPKAVKELDHAINLLPQGDFIARWNQTLQLKKIHKDVGVNENGMINYPEIASTRRELTGIGSDDINRQLNELARPAAEQAYPIVRNGLNNPPKNEAEWDLYWRSYNALDAYISQGNQPGGNLTHLSHLGLTSEQWELLQNRLPTLNTGNRNTTQTEAKDVKKESASSPQPAGPHRS